MAKKKVKKTKKPVEKKQVKKNNDVEISMIGGNLVNSMDDAEAYQNAVRTPKDLFAPDAIVVLDEKTLKVGDKFVRNYVMQGYPSVSYVGWLDKMFSYNGDFDTMIYVDPSDDRRAAEELTEQITKIMAQRESEVNKGRISNISRYNAQIAQLEQERSNIELNRESLYQVGIFGNLVADSLEELNKKAEMLESSMKGQRVHLMPTALRMVDGYKSTLPSMFMQYEDKLRNFNTGAVVSCFPFYNAEICHIGGTLIGINTSTNTPMFINFYDKHAVVNTNISVFGRAGSGKTFLVSLLTMRSALQGIHSAIIDPEGEYKQIALAMGGINIDIRPGSRSFINMFDVEEERETDDDGHLTGRTFVDLTSKIADLLDLISVMCKGEITQEQRSLVSGVIQLLYDRFGITEDPSSLYVNTELYNEKTGELTSSGTKKKMPTFSDFHELLEREIEITPKFAVLRSLANQLKMFKKGGPYDLFDCQSTVDTSMFSKVPVINFNVSQLEEGILRPIGMYVAMSYIWEKIIKKNFETRKRLIVDEAWMLLNQSFAGHEYTSAFLEKCARRIRKRNAGLLVASQNFIEFSSCNEGKSVLSNTAVRIFLKQSETDLGAVQEEFNLSMGEVNYLSTANIGEFLIKTDTESSIGLAVSSPYERNLLTKKNPVQMR